MPPVSGGCAGLRGAGRGSRLLVPAAADGRGEVGVRCVQYSTVQYRSVFAAAALEGEIYVCGGQGEDGEATASCEKFSPKLGRCVSKLSTLSITIYLHLSTIYIYTRWRPLPDMCRPRRGHVAVVLEGVVFVLGGDTDTCEW